MWRNRTSLASPMGTYHGEAIVCDRVLQKKKKTLNIELAYDPAPPLLGNNKDQGLK